jgi:AraC-like DNA-binding protein
MIDLLVIRTLRTWAERDPRPSASLRDDRIAKVLRSIHGEPAHPWTLDSLAQRAAMSRSAFAEHFTKLVGYSPLRYLTRWRLSLADELLRSGSVGVAVAAQRVGYSSEAGFSRAFKAHHGYAPNAAKPRSEGR